MTTMTSVIPVTVFLTRNGIVVILTCVRNINLFQSLEPDHGSIGDAMTLDAHSTTLAH